MDGISAGPITEPVTDYTPPAAEARGFFGHPRGLATLFFTEMWERFSYYGMRAFLILYMVHALNFDDKHAGSVYGTYTASAWALAIFGGIIADRWLGQYKSVLIGGIIIAIGHFTLAFHALGAFYSGLAFIAVGTGLLKPNVSGIVGSLYDRSDTRRDAGFSIFYMGINLGAALGPLVAGYLAQKVDWHLGFACAGVGMTLGLIQYVAGRRHLQPAIDRLAQQRRAAAADRAADKLAPTSTGGGATFVGFTSVEWKRIAAMAVFFVFAAIFWGAYEQAGSTLNLFGDRYTRTTVLGFSFPSSWFVSVQAVLVIVLAPAFAWLWTALGPREPSTPAKFAIGLFFVGLSFVLLLVPAFRLQATPGLRVSPLWLVGCYFIQELGELSISPVGLSVFTKLSPVKIVGFMLGVWFLADSVGNKVAGLAAGFISSAPMPQLFGVIGGVCLAASVVAFLIIKPVRGLMGGVH
ncbi:MAG TPA: peptide MFS transporter [Gemmatimonadaceae bacterium]|jgi:POT family proton-dependent oligopeptide transporter|nr:peptide MFS transporter [Gemmatimonadaceae bacterium]